MRRIYLAGPMTGLPEFNFPAFNAEAARLRAAGDAVTNPAEHGIIDGYEWVDYMKLDIQMLAACNTIHLLPGWSKSRGASIEYRLAKDLGLQISFAHGAEPFEPNPVEAFLDEVRAELKRARSKFPGDRLMTLALAEEFGELCKAVLDESAENVRKEAVQTAVMCCRVVLDGDGSVRSWRSARGLDALKAV
ncbi:DUF4406 domain-containing protein [Pseudomonas sp. USHLN015]|uniref:DUF4406 domain-containing protein n=1 Tax=Pseudomonas sp. USHLN015 TaxID=3081296 RepID=UPI00301C1B08